MNNVKEIEKGLFELSTSFIALFDKLKKSGVISQEEYDTHTKSKKEFLQKISNNL